MIDFYCPELGLAVEIDGGVHADPAARVLDAERQALLEKRGIRFLRIRTDVVMDDIEAAINKIREACANSPSPRARGEGVRG